MCRIASVFLHRKMRIAFHFGIVGHLRSKGRTSFGDQHIPQIMEALAGSDHHIEEIEAPLVAHAPDSTSVQHEEGCVLSLSLARLWWT